MAKITKFLGANRFRDPLQIFRTPEEAPEKEESEAAPVVNDEESKRRLARKMQRKYAGAGREGTVLSDEGLG